jgi:hypothetical protein
MFAVTQTSFTTRALRIFSTTPCEIARRRTLLAMISTNPEGVKYHMHDSEESMTRLLNRTLDNWD